jgi:hypothetical protein
MRASLISDSADCPRCSITPCMWESQRAVLTSGFNYDPERLSQTGIYYDEAAPPGAGDHRGLELSTSGRTCSLRTSPI